MSINKKFWKRAKKVIPGGTMLLSKRPSLYLPDEWPTYFTKSKGYKVYDLDNVEYNDLIFAVGTNVLGYSNNAINSAVKKSISKGNMTSLNCSEEVILAEKLIEIHPWSKMVRFARSGGEANAIAIRIARAASNKDNIAICGYHGWHDWYLSANLNRNNNLSDHILPGLKPKGVPRGLKNTVFPFEYNNIEKLKSIISNHNIGVIKMEIARYQRINTNFLKEVRKLANKYNIVLIFDECTSGFRESYGGLHTIYNINPDICIFGKALGNGYAITAVIGKKEIMENAQDTFISSTFWTERIGPVAGLQTIEEMKKIESWKQIKKTGKQIKKTWKRISEETGVHIKCFGIDSIPWFNFEAPNSLELKTYLTKEFLKSKFLASNFIFVSTVHNKKILNLYYEKLYEIFRKISKHNTKNKKKKILNSKICDSGFARLN